MPATSRRVPLSTYRAQRRGGKGRAGMQTRDEDFVSRLFVASTHTPVLFFSSRGQVYKEKVWRLPVGSAEWRGKALINILPLEQGERITTIMPLPEDESSWANLDVMFATTGGTVRRNKLSDFVDVRRSGIIAMKLGEGEAIVDVPDLHRARRRAADGGRRAVHPLPRHRCARLHRPYLDGRARHCAGRERHPDSLSILRHVETTSDERSAYLKMRRAVAGETAPKSLRMPRARRRRVRSSSRRNAMPNCRQRNRSCSRVRQRLRQAHLDLRIPHHGPRRQRHRRDVGQQPQRQAGGVIPVEDSDQIMLVTDKGQLIRCPVEGIRIAGPRSTQGVIVFDTAEDEHVVSVEHIGDDGENGGNGE